MKDSNGRNSMRAFLWIKHYSRSHSWLLIAILGLFIVAVISTHIQFKYVIVLYLLFIPLIDSNLIKTGFSASSQEKFYGLSSSWLTMVGLILILIILLIHPNLIKFSFITLVLVALPEEWFFRGYLQRGLGQGVSAIFVSSVIFSMTHGITVSWTMAGLVFIPSLLFGFVYWKTNNLLLVVVLHTLANLFPRLMN